MPLADRKESLFGPVTLHLCYCAHQVSCRPPALHRVSDMVSLAIFSPIITSFVSDIFVAGSVRSSHLGLIPLG